jgi:hypothetical protein
LRLWGRLRDDHDGETVKSFQVHGDRAENAVIFVGRATDDNGDTHVGPVLAAKFVGDGAELTGDRAVPTLKVPARLSGTQLRSNIAGQVSREIV